MSAEMPDSLAKHAPKTAALVAYAAGSLSGAGEARLEKHLRGCDACRRELARIRAYEEVSGEVRVLPVPKVDFARMELALAREARAVATRARVRRAVWPALAAAAAVLAVAYLATRGEPEVARDEPRVEERRPETPALPAVPMRARIGSVTAVAGDVQVIATDGTATAARVGTEIAEAARVTTGEAASAHVRVAEGTGFVLHDDTDLTVAVLREDEAVLALARGTVSQQVAPLGERGRFEIEAGEYAVRVRGTRFSVTRDAGDIAVTLDEGIVEVLRDGELLERLVAPARWSSGGGASGLAQNEVPAPRAIAEAALAWPVITLPASTRIVRWEIDGTKLDAADRIAMRVPAGELTVRGWDRSGLELVATLQIAGDGSALDEVALRPVGERGLAPQGHLEAEQITPVVRAGQPSLERCYRRALLRNPDLAGRYTLRITVGRRGTVESADLRAAEGAVPTELAACVASEARQWAFPPPGGRVRFDAPLSFASRGQ